MKIFRNVIAVIAGIIIGGFINMGIIMIQGKIIALPDGFDLNNFSESIKLLETKHFILPFFSSFFRYFCRSIYSSIDSL
ncbi:MAG: hypothetical protein R2771_10240 [Saprospiraceae bacterium]